MANETKERFNGVGRFLKSYNNAEKLLTKIIIFAVIALAIVMAFHVMQLQIFLTWQIAITVFILILPVCLFLQAFMNVEAVKDERYSKFQEGFRKAYANYIKKYHPQVLKEEDYENDDKFRSLIRERTLFLMDDGQLYSIYRQAFQLYLAYKNKRIRIKGNPELKEIKDWLLRFELDELLKIIVSRQMKEDGTDFPSYLLPLSFFLFMYFSGFLVVTSFVDAIFNPGQGVNDAYIPLFPGQQIPIVVVQWGFMGGLVYTSISLLNRFLRNDLVPRVYFNAAFRLILSAVVAIVIYFIYMFANPTGQPGNTTPAQILLLCFLAGVAPIQFLIHFADSQLSKLNGDWKRRSTPGNRPITQLEGIDSVTSQRLSEEGINYVQEMALCNYIELSSKTNFPLEIVYNWKDQAILHTLTGGIIVCKGSSNKSDSKSLTSGTEFLSDTLDEKLGIRTITSFIDIWENISTKKENEINAQRIFLNGIFNFDEDDKKFIQSKYLFDNIVKQGKAMINNSIPIYPIDGIPVHSNGQKTNFPPYDTDPNPTKILNDQTGIS